MRDADHKNGSVQRLIPLSSSAKTSIAPDVMSARFSSSWNRRRTRGTTPTRAASRTSNASAVVLIHPRSTGLSDASGTIGAGALKEAVTDVDAGEVSVARDVRDIFW